MPGEPVVLAQKSPLIVHSDVFEAQFEGGYLENSGVVKVRVNSQSRNYWKFNSRMAPPVRPSRSVGWLVGRSTCHYKKGAARYTSMPLPVHLFYI